MSEAVDFLISAPRSFEVTRVFSQHDFWHSIRRGFLLIRFAESRGGTELRLRLDSSTVQRANEADGLALGSFQCAGSCTLDGAVLRFNGTVDTLKLHGTGFLAFGETAATQS